MFSKALPKPHSLLVIPGEMENEMILKNKTVLAVN